MWRIARCRQRERPVSFKYEPWPAVHLPPYGFTHPVREAAASASAVEAPIKPTGKASPRQLAKLQQMVTRLEDEREIEILQRTYGYYVDKNLWTEIPQLFTEDGTLEIGGRGVFVGRKRVQQYLEWLGFPGARPAVRPHADAAHRACVARWHAGEGSLARADLRR